MYGGEIPSGVVEATELDSRGAPHPGRKQDSSSIAEVSNCSSSHGFIYSNPHSSFLSLAAWAVRATGLVDRPFERIFRNFARNLGLKSARLAGRRLHPRLVTDRGRQNGLFDFP
jgi:hypothetical protein